MLPTQGLTDKLGNVHVNLIIYTLKIQKSWFFSAAQG